jgi:hypothetical protein
MEQVRIDVLREKYTAEKYQNMSDAELARRYTNATGIPVTGVEKEIETPELTQYEQISLGEDLSKSLGSAAWSALAGIIGLPGAVTNTAEMGMDRIGMGSRDEDERAFGFPEANAAINKFRDKLPPILAGTDPTYEPQSRPGRYLKTGSELAASGGAGGMRKMAQQVIAPTILSEGGKDAFEGTVLETPAQIAGLMAGGKAVDVAENMFSGGKVAPSHLQAVKTLEDAGVTPTAGQATDQSNLSFAEEATTSGKAKRQAAVDQFTDAAITTAIPPSLRDKVQITPGMMPQDKMAALRTTITDTMDQLAARNSVPITVDLAEAFAKISKDYDQKLSAAEKSPYFKNLAKEMTALAGAGQLKGSAYQSIRSSLSELSTKDAITKKTAIKAIKALEDAMGKQIAKGKNIDDIALYKDVRKGYSDLMILEAASKRNKNIDFNISPSALSSAAAAKDAQSYIYGRDTFSDLYRAGNTVLKSADNPSRTAGTLRAMVGHMPSLSAGAGVGLATGIDPWVTMAGMGALPWVRNQALQSDLAQKYFKSTMRPGERAPVASAPGILVGLQELQQSY